MKTWSSRQGLGQMSVLEVFSIWLRDRVLKRKREGKEQKKQEERAAYNLEQQKQSRWVYWKDEEKDIHFRLIN
jgi:hypothetical protein